MHRDDWLGFSRTAVAVAVAVMATTAAMPALAQNTTAAVNGVVTGADGKPVAGAVVTIVHVESGSTNTATTDADGRYAARGLRTGGPFTITVSKGGQSDKIENIFLALAETQTIGAKLGTATQTVVVTGRSASERFNRSNMGASTSVSNREISTYASVQRSLQDYARLDPRVAQTDKDRGEISVAGQNSRYNSITIDGVGINDTFGLEANNLPMLKQPISIDAIQSVQINVSNFDTTLKGYTGANINAVTKSGTNDFRGSVYYVFRDDSLAGKRFVRTDQSYADPPVFKEETRGLTFGGPIIKDKLFFFGSYEELTSTRDAPIFGPLGSGLTNVGITPTAITSAQGVARTTYAVDIGSSDIPAGTQLKVTDTLLKLDWNISDSHRANLRYTKTEQIEPNFRNFGNRSISLNSNWDSQVKNLETAVVQWFADWTPTLSTEFKLSSRKYDSVFNLNSNLPQATLSFAGTLPPSTPASVATGTRSLVFGTDRFRHFNVLKTDTVDAYLGANWTLGDHELKFGADFADNEIFNAFLQDTKGVYTFACVNSSATYTYTFGAINCGATTTTAAQIEQAVLENFQRGRPSTYQVQAAVAGRTLDDAAAKWSLANLGVFLQDTWKVNSALTVMGGLRLDRQSTSDRPARNVTVALPVGSADPVTGRQTGGFGLDNTQTIDGENLVQPRIGFNWKLPGEQRSQLRGGVGLFQGAAANVWLTNPFSNSGVTTRVVGCGISGFSACAATGGVFSADPNNQPTSFVGAVGAANVDIVAPGVAQPSVWKVNLGLDAEIPGLGWVASVEYLHTRTKAGLHYEHLNLGAPTRTGTDGRLLYYTPQGYNENCWTAGGASINTGTTCTGFRNRALSNAQFADVVVARNTTQGTGNTVTVALTRPAIDGFGWGVAYTKSNASEVNPLTSSRAISNWTARSAFNPNEEVTANSSYLVPERVTANLSWTKAFFSKYRSSVGLFYEGKRGKPYSWTYINDINGDGQGGNDLMYIPSQPGSGEVVFRGDTTPNGPNEQRFWEVVNAYKELGNNKGGTSKRNGSFAPFVNNFDLRLSQELPGFAIGHKGVITLDILNVGNLMNKKWGRIDEVSFVTAAGGVSRSFVNYGGLDAQGRYIYNMGSTEDYVTKQSRGESQWAAQITLKYQF